MIRKQMLAPIRLLLLFLALILGTTLVGQEKQLTDEKITNRVEAEMVFQSDVPSGQIDAATNEGIVTLAGTVDNLLAKSRAATVATAVKGVTGVVNLIEVDPPFRTDYTIRSDVEKSLLQDPAADSYEVDVLVDNGAVTLNGRVDSWQEKQLAGYIAKSVKGVKSLDNNIDINFTSNRPDYEIREEVKKAIANDIRLNREMIEVSVDNNVVTLEGTVGSLNAKRQAQSYGWTSGVKDVKSDELKVADWAKDNYLKKKEYPIRPDKEIKQAVKTAFLYDPRVYSFNPEVTVTNGTVTLSGKVDNLKAKRAAEADARNIVGAFSVLNNIKVRPELIPSNEELEDNVEDALFRDPYVERFGLTVAANNGVIYLSGKVDNSYEKYRAEDIASRTNGVLNVVNNIDVSTTSNYDYYYPYGWNTYYPSPYTSPEGYYTYRLNDPQIRQNIRDELWWSPFVTESQVNVEVSNRVATLTGTVDSWDEREAATENAYEGGAFAVINRLDVADEAR